MAILMVLMLPTFDINFSTDEWFMIAGFTTVSLLIVIFLFRQKEPTGFELVASDSRQQLPVSLIPRGEQFERQIQLIKSRLLAHWRGSLGHNTFIQSSSSAHDSSNDGCPADGIYRVQAPRDMPRGTATRPQTAMLRFLLDIKFRSSQRTPDFCYISGKGVSLNEERQAIFTIKEGCMLKHTGDAYWVSESNSSEREHVASGKFNLQANCFRGTFLLDNNRGCGILLLQRTEHYGHVEQLRQEQVVHQPSSIGIPIAEAVVLVDEPQVEPLCLALDSHQIDQQSCQSSRTSHQQQCTSENIASVAENLDGCQRHPDWYCRAVDNASLKTTEVGPERTVISSASQLNGGYDIQYANSEEVLRNSAVVGSNFPAPPDRFEATAVLIFERAFCGWSISGSRMSVNIDRSSFTISKGFLSQSGKIYWEEKANFEPSYSILVVGKLSHGVFNGAWLSSNGGKGRVTKFLRQESANEVAEPSSEAII